MRNGQKSVAKRNVDMIIRGDFNAARFQGTPLAYADIWWDVYLIACSDGLKLKNSSQSSYFLFSFSRMHFRGLERPEIHVSLCGIRECPVTPLCTNIIT